MTKANKLQRDVRRTFPAALLWLIYIAGMVHAVVLVPLLGAPRKAAGLAVVLLTLLAALEASLAARILQLDKQTRRAWRFIGASLMLFLVASTLITVLPRSEVFPSIGDYVRLLSMSGLLLGLHLFPLATATHLERLKLGIDAAIVLAGGTVAIWYFVLAPHLQNRDSATVVLGGSIYPIMDLMLLFVGVRLALRAGDLSTRSSARLLAGALLLLTTVDTYESYRQATTPGSGRGNAAEVAAVLTTFLLFALASQEQHRHAGQPTSPVARQSVSISWLPYVAVGICCALMVGEGIRNLGLSRLGGTMFGTTAVIALVLVRQLMTQHENHNLVVTDRLTGIANRARIDDHLARRLALGARNSRPTALLLLDLDGFKEVNDTFGHQAGDALLVEFAAILRRCVLGGDVVGRLGGDEFVVILGDGSGLEDAKAVAKRITAALAQPVQVGGTLVQPSASIGLASSGPGELSAEQLLHQADVAMYQNKKKRADQTLAFFGSHKPAV